MERVMFESGRCDIKIGIDEMPHRKKPCLVVEQHHCETKYATFNDEFAAYDFVEVLKKFLGIEDDYKNEV